MSAQPTTSASSRATTVPDDSSGRGSRPRQRHVFSATPNRYLLAGADTPVAPPFINKLRDIVDDPSTDDLVSWRDDGRSFEVHLPSELAQKVLPHYFKHNNFTSFVRQLNQYRFRKLDTDRFVFGHEAFQRDAPDLAAKIERRRPGIGKTDADASAGAAGSALDATATRGYGGRDGDGMYWTGAHDWRVRHNDYWAGDGAAARPPHGASAWPSGLSPTAALEIGNYGLGDYEPARPVTGGAAEDARAGGGAESDPYYPSTRSLAFDADARTGSPPRPVQARGASPSAGPSSSSSYPELETLRRDKKFLVSEQIASRHRQANVQQRMERGERRIRELESNMDQLKQFLIKSFEHVMQQSSYAQSNKRKRLTAGDAAHPDEQDAGGGGDDEHGSSLPPSPSAVLWPDNPRRARDASPQSVWAHASGHRVTEHVDDRGAQRSSDGDNDGDDGAAVDAYHDGPYPLARATPHTMQYKAGASARSTPPSSSQLALRQKAPDGADFLQSMMQQLRMANMIGGDGGAPAAADDDDDDAMYRGGSNDNGTGADEYAWQYAPLQPPSPPQAQAASSVRDQNEWWRQRTPQAPAGASAAQTAHARQPRTQRREPSVGQRPPAQHGATAHRAHSWSLPTHPSSTQRASRDGTQPETWQQAASPPRALRAEAPRRRQSWSAAKPQQQSAQLRSTLPYSAASSSRTRVDDDNQGGSGFAGGDADASFRDDNGASSRGEGPCVELLQDDDDHDDGGNNALTADTAAAHDRAHIVSGTPNSASHAGAPVARTGATVKTTCSSTRTRRQCDGDNNVVNDDGGVAMTGGSGARAPHAVVPSHGHCAHTSPSPSSSSSSSSSSAAAAAAAAASDAHGAHAPSTRQLNSDGRAGSDGDDNDVDPAHYLDFDDLMNSALGADGEPIQLPAGSDPDSVAAEVQRLLGDGVGGGGGGSSSQ